MTDTCASVSNATPCGCLHALPPIVVVVLLLAAIAAESAAPAEAALGPAAAGGLLLPTALVLLSSWWSCRPTGLARPGLMRPHDAGVQINKAVHAKSSTNENFMSTNGQRAVRVVVLRQLKHPKKAGCQRCGPASRPVQCGICCVDRRSSEECLCTRSNQVPCCCPRTCTVSAIS